MFKTSLTNQSSFSLVSLTNESPPDVFQSASQSSWAKNVRQLYAQSGQLGPLPLPFPTERLLKTQIQSLQPYRQVSSKQGSFVLLNTDKLPAGGSVHKEKTNCASVSIKLVGDIGLRGTIQFDVAKSIEYSIRTSKKSNQHPFVLVVGDWVYPRGPVDNSTEEARRTQSDVLNVYQKLSKKCMVTGVLGNHEYGDNKMAADPAVFMKLAEQNGIQVNRYGRHTIESEKFKADVFFIDSTVIAVDDKQVQWISDEISTSMAEEQETGKKTWRLIASHHPIVSFGMHASETTYIGELFDTSNIDLWLSGHEHDIEIIPARTNSPPTIVSGTGSTQRGIDMHPEAAFLSNEAGFVNLQINEYDIQIKPELAV
jgi:tartrate-resistant acid phosphatase type 5